MILVDARCSILAERQDDFTREVKKNIPRVRLEDGCRRYELCADILNPGIFHFIEEWENQEALDRHIAQPHMQEYFAKTAPWHAAATVLTIYTILSSQSLTMKD
jgi:quinol monooxygenase YgiN